MLGKVICSILPALSQVTHGYNIPICVGNRKEQAMKKRAPLIPGLTSCKHLFLSWSQGTHHGLRSRIKVQSLL